MTRELSWPAELDLLVECCRWPPSPDRDEAVRTRTATLADWDGFGATVARHRVAPLAADSLRRAGVTVPPAVAADAAREAQRSLVMAAETLRIGEAFEAAGIDILFFKGSTLGSIVFGDPGLKQSCDIDLLVTDGDTLEAYRLLCQLGYRLHYPAVSERQLLRFRAVAKECILVSPRLGTVVELHWRLADNRLLLAAIGMASPRQQVAIAGRPVPTLADAPLFAYLCVHGTVHGWARLKWIAELNAFLARKDPHEVVSLYREAERLEAGRAPAVALRLCRHLFGLRLDPQLEREVLAQQGAAALAATAMKAIAHPSMDRQGGALSLPDLRVVRSQFAILPSARFTWTQMLLYWKAAPERIHLELPDWLGFVFHLLRVPLFIGRRGRGLVAWLRA